MIASVLKGTHPSLAVQRVALAKRTYADAAAAKGYLTAKGLPVATDLADGVGAWVAELRPVADFVPGSERIVYDGAVELSIGLLAKVEKAAASVPMFKAEDLAILGDLDLLEVTLCKQPVLGELAGFRVVKSVDDAFKPTIIKSGQILRRDDAAQIVYGYALIPDLPDWQGDIVPSQDVERAAHSLLKNIAKGLSKPGGTGVEHQTFGPGYPVESYIDYAGQHGIPGGWWVGIKIEDEAVWKSVLSGDLKGFSIGGRAGRREPLVTLAGVLKARFGEDVAKAQLTFAEIRIAVSAAIAAREGYRYDWIEAIYEGRVVYRMGDALWMASYSIDEAGVVTLEPSIQVRIEYVTKGGIGWGAEITPLSKGARQEQEMDQKTIEEAIAKGFEVGMAKVLENLNLNKSPTPTPTPAQPDPVAKALGEIGQQFGQFAKTLEQLALPRTTSKAAPPIAAPVAESPPSAPVAKSSVDYGDPIWGLHGNPSKKA